MAPIKQAILEAVDAIYKERFHICDEVSIRSLLLRRRDITQTSIEDLLFYIQELVSEGLLVELGPDHTSKWRLATPIEIIEKRGVKI